MDVYQNHFDPDITGLTPIPFVLDDVGLLDQSYLQKLSDKFGVKWISRLENDEEHPSLGVVIVGRMGNEQNIIYESWLVGNQYVPQHAISYKTPYDEIWWRTPIRDALKIEDLGWFNFLQLLYINNYDGLSFEVVTKIQKIILEKL